MKVLSPEKFINLPDAILFDTDNTLYSYSEPDQKAMNAVRLKVTETFSITSDDFDAAFHAARHEIKERLGRTASSHSRLLYLQRLLEILGLGSQVLMALDLEQTYWRTFLSKSMLFSGIRKFIDQVRILGIPLVIITDLTAQIQFRKIVYFGLDRYFDYIVTSEEAGRDKPHPNPFRLAIEKLEIDVETCWMIGDDYLSDIVGSKEAIQAVTLYKTDGSRNDISSCHQCADLIFSDYNKLYTLLSSLSKCKS